MCLKVTRNNDNDNIIIVVLWHVTSKIRECKDFHGIVLWHLKLGCSSRNILMHPHGTTSLLCTQNIDTLEHVAGLPADKVVEAHGTFRTSHCIACHKEYTQDWMKGMVIIMYHFSSQSLHRSINSMIVRLKMLASLFLP